MALKPSAAAAGMGVKGAAPALGTKGAADGVQEAVVVDIPVLGLKSEVVTLKSLKICD